MAKDFQVGETVQLKSGGPRMTVQNVAGFHETLSIHCQWFAGDLLQGGAFPRESLKRLDADQEKDS